MYEFKFQFEDGSEIHLTRVLSFPDSPEHLNVVTDPSMKTFICILATKDNALNCKRERALSPRDTNFMVHHFESALDIESYGVTRDDMFVIPLEGCTYRWGKNLMTGHTLEEERRLYLRDLEKQQLWDAFMNNPDRPMIPIEQHSFLNQDNLWNYYKKTQLWNKVYKEENDTFREVYLPQQDIGGGAGATVPVVFTPDELWVYKAWRDFQTNIKQCDPTKNLPKGYEILKKISNSEMNADLDSRMPEDMRRYWIPIEEPLLSKKELEEAERNIHRGPIDVMELWGDYEDD